MNSQTDDEGKPTPQQSARPLRILSAGDLYHINEEVTNHAAFVRDQQLLRSAVSRPYLIVFGEEQFPTLLDKAAAMMHSVAAHHLFVDGNKRTAVRATALFLEANGIRPTWDEEECRAFVLEIARSKVSIETIAAWLAKNTAPMDEEAPD